MAVFCHRCGTGLPSSARFCSGCGAGVPVTSGVSGPAAGEAAVWAEYRRRMPGSGADQRMGCGRGAGDYRDRMFFSGGIVSIAYLAGWIGIPEEPLIIPGMYPPAGTYPPNQGAYPPS